MKNKLLICFTFLVSSCATLYRGNKAIVHISSEPQHAAVLLNGKQIGETPVTLKIKRSLFKTYNLELQKNGYKNDSFVITKKFLPISILSNTFIFIDALSGGIVNFRKHYYNEKLISSGEDSSPVRDYNLKDNFYVITKTDTFYTEPFQQINYKNLFSSTGDLIQFKLLDGEVKAFPLFDIEEIKTLEIYRHTIGQFFLTLQTHINFMEKKYIKVIHKETPKKTVYDFMEELLVNRDVHLVKSLVDITSVNSANGQLAYVGNKPYYYIYIPGQKLSMIKQKDLAKTIEAYFDDRKELISLLSKKNKFKVLEKYVYRNTSGADRFWNVI